MRQAVWLSVRPALLAALVLVPGARGFVCSTFATCACEAQCSCEIVNYGVGNFNLCTCDPSVGCGGAHSHSPHSHTPGGGGGHPLCSQDGQLTSTCSCGLDLTFTNPICVAGQVCICDVQGESGASVFCYCHGDASPHSHHPHHPHTPHSHHPHHPHRPHSHHPHHPHSPASDRPGGDYVINKGYGSGPCYIGTTCSGGHGSAPICPGGYTQVGHATGCGYPSSSLCARSLPVLEPATRVP